MLCPSLLNKKSFLFLSFAFDRHSDLPVCIVAYVQVENGTGATMEPKLPNLRPELSEFVPRHEVGYGSDLPCCIVAYVQVENGTRATMEPKLPNLRPELSEFVPRQTLSYCVRQASKLF